MEVTIQIVGVVLLGLAVLSWVLLVGFLIWMVAVAWPVWRER